MASLTRTIAASSDDAFQGGTTMDLTINNLNANAANQYIGLRFQNITIPPGSTINNAYLECNLVNNSFDDPDVTIDCQAHDNASTFTATNNDISGRTLTSNGATWTASSIGTGYKSSPAFTAAMQAVVNRGGWADGNAVVVVMKGNSGSSAFRIKAFDLGGGDYTNLVVDYTPPSGGGIVPLVMHHRIQLGMS